VINLLPIANRHHLHHPFRIPYPAGVVGKGWPTNLRRRIGARLVVVCAFTLLLAAESARGDIPLEIESIQGLPDSVVQLDDGVTQLRGPQTLYLKSSTPVSDPSSVLEFEYFCIGGIASPTAMVGPGDDSKSEQAVVRKLEPLEHRETWSRYATQLNPQDQASPSDWSQFRLELPLKGDQVLQIRRLRFRSARRGEFDGNAHAVAGENARPVAADAGVLEAYLQQEFPCKVTRVQVGLNDIFIEGSIDSAAETLRLADIPMETILGSDFNSVAMIDVVPDPQGRFSVQVPRITLRDGREYDRLTSRWQLLRREDNAWRPVSHARYGDEVYCHSPELALVQPSSKKGLGGWTPSRLPETPNELQELGITSVTVNVAAIHRFLSLVPQDGHRPFQWQGKTYYANERELARYDETFRQAEKAGAMVSAILLISNPTKSRDPVASLLAHPDVDESGTYAMPNVTSREGLELYGAILDFVVQRWSKDDGVHGRVHHWIVHNEVDAGWVWTNAGEKEAITYMDLYQRSMRLIHLVARQYDPHSQAFITLTHHWAKAGNPRFFGSKQMLQLLVRFCAAEGDFQWGLAYHPYPQNLFKPRTWEDHQATFDFDTDKITPKNLEVLDAFMKQPTLRFQGRVRTVHLSENGFNSLDYSDESLRDQAAGMAYAWKKVSGLSAIDVWHYHNWIDNRHEGGLRIGLRKFPDDPEDPLGKKPIWFVYQAYGTPQEEAVFEPYLETIGLTDWDEVIFRQPISDSASVP